MRRKIVISLMALIIIMVFTIPASAEVTKYVVQMTDGTIVEYSCQQLDESYLNLILGLPGEELYNDYASGQLVAVFDTNHGYMDFNNIQNAYVSSVLDGTNFDLNSYVATPEAIPAQMPDQVVEATLGTDGQLEKTIKPIEAVLPQGVKSFSVIDSTIDGYKTFTVELSTTTPQKYDVFVKDTQCTFDEATGNFTADILEADAIAANIRIVEIPPLPDGVKSFKKVSSLELGKVMVVVELTSPAPEKYNVYIKTVRLKFSSESGKFIADVPVADALPTNISIVELPQVKSFQAYSSLEIGKKLIVVQLDTINPAEYKVFCGDVELNYNAAAQKFTGLIAENAANQANITVTNQ